MDLFEELGLEHAEMPASNSPFDLMASLDDTYGFDQDEASVDARCAEARLLMFNEYHETDPDAFHRRATVLCNTLEVELEAYLDEYEDVEALVEAFNEVLARRGEERCFAVGEDTYVLLLFRAERPARLEELGEPYS